MLTPVGIGPHGIGFTVDECCFSHSGRNHGFNGIFRAHRLRGSGYAIMTNSDSPAFVELLDAEFGALLSPD
jgi:hypothetical protein